jgi:hypothetical protein
MGKHDQPEPWKDDGQVPPKEPQPDPREPKPGRRSDS